jgi:hypothetical protein
MRFKGPHRAAVASCLALGVACASADPPHPGENGVERTDAEDSAIGVVHDVSPLYTIDLGDSRAIYLWEHAPGHITYSESAAAGTVLPHLAYDLSGRVTEKFSRLRPGEVVPEVLARAQEREDVRIAELGVVGNFHALPQGAVVSESPAAVTSPSVVLREDSALTLVPKDAWSDWFEANVCQEDVLERWPHIGRIEFCALWRGGGGTWYFSDKMELLAAVMPFSGTVTFRLTVKWNGGPSTTVQSASVSAGWAYAWEFYGEGITEHDYKFDLLNAEGDAYHRAVVYAINSCKRPGQNCGPHQSSSDQCFCWI